MKTADFKMKRARIFSSRTMIFVMILTLLSSAPSAFAASSKKQVARKEVVAKKTTKKTLKKNTLTKISNAKQKRSLSGITDSQRELEIRGQSRNLSMLLVLKNRNENIDFVKPRDSFREEIHHTGY